MLTLKECLDRLERVEPNEVDLAKEGMKIFQEIWGSVVLSLEEGAISGASEAQFLAPLDAANGLWKKVVERYPRIFLRGAFVATVKEKLPGIYREWELHTRRHKQWLV